MSSLDTHWSFYSKLDKLYYYLRKEKTKSSLAVKLLAGEEETSMLCTKGFELLNFYHLKKDNNGLEDI